MNAAPHPAEVLYGGGRPFPALAACEHYAGSEKLLLKALALQATLQHGNLPLFDVTADCEDGAPVGHEAEHAALIAALLNSSDNRYDRLGARIHDVRHSTWQDELETIVGSAGQRLAYLVLPKASGVADIVRQIAALAACCARHDIRRSIPVHVLIETPGALHEAWQIAALPEVESLDFGLMDYVSAQHGAIPASAMRSPGQFTHPLIVRAKCAIAAAALGNGVVPTHNVTTEFRDLAVVAADARRAREEFGFLRMWSIHPGQIEPIIAALRPTFEEVTEAGATLCAAADAHWGPIQRDGRLHDRASYRYDWELLQRADVTGVDLPAEVRSRFFNKTNK
jgi:citrate lyase subunit beta/citryl-CoA lyase